MCLDRGQNVAKLGASVSVCPNGAVPGVHSLFWLSGRVRKDKGPCGLCCVDVLLAFKVFWVLCLYL